ncbi:hypothetical protein DJ95_1375 [Bacillus atrophaeus subsp. globigii]|nr:hypothetical protein DJ95_1375 [Bacillus atrophaeus subsp. globigii]KFK82331.1 hypothetical protein DK44_2261 [Bacillus atrophaeus]
MKSYYCYPAEYDFCPGGGCHGCRFGLYSVPHGTFINYVITKYGCFNGTWKQFVCKTSR